MSMNKDWQGTSTKEWYERRVIAIEKIYGAYDALTENGAEIAERGSNQQILCPFHSDTRPSARYYGTTGKEHFHCFTCKVHESAVGLYARFKNIKHSEALIQLERRFNLKTPRRPEETIHESIVEKSSHYESEAWSDVPRVLELLEKKLMRLRDKVALTDFVRFCRVLDTVKWDFEHNGRASTPPMIEILIKLRKVMDDSMVSDVICD
jgi:hypothetical protein